MKNYLCFFICFSFLIFSQSCREDNIREETDITIPEPDTGIVSDLSGIIIDENNEPIQGANLNLGNEMAMSDENGHFVFQNVIINSNGSPISIEKSGYFSNYKFIFPELNTAARTKIQLIPRIKVGEFVGTQEGKISHGDVKIDFPENAIVDADGNPYQSTVSVYSHWYDPTDDALILNMPGDLRATDLEGDDVQLSTYGMLAVELESTSGEKLQIAPEKTARLTFPIPIEIAGDAPDEIPSKRGRIVHPR